MVMNNLIRKKRIETQHLKKELHKPFYNRIFYSDVIAITAYIWLKFKLSGKSSDNRLDKLTLTA